MAMTHVPDYKITWERLADNEYRGHSRKGFLSVDDGASLFWEIHGDPNGAPVIFAHGGSGFAYKQKDGDFFDFNKQRVLFFDPRGCGHSIPSARAKKEFENNDKIEFENKAKFFKGTVSMKTYVE